MIETSRDARITRRTAVRTGAAATGLFGAGVGTGAAQSGGSGSGEGRYYQVDFVAGRSIETVGGGEDDFYGRQNRLVQYLHGTDSYVVKRDTWLNSLDPAVRRHVTAEPIRIADDAASVRFRVVGEGERTYPLAVYSLPGGEFSFDVEQELLAAETGTFGPGTHELAVEGFSAALSETGCRPPAHGYVRVANLLADDGGRGDRLGNTIAASASGETVVVGARGDDSEGYLAGSAYVFELTDGERSQRTKLAPESMTFGRSVTVSDSGGTVVVGSPYDLVEGAEVGAGYVFERADGGWTQETKLTDRSAGTAGATIALGSSVALSAAGDTAVLGAPTADNAGTWSGMAYVFERTDGGWTQRAKLIPDDTQAGDFFGASVALSASGGTAVVGAPTDSQFSDGFESAYVFERTDEGWSQRAKLVGDEGAWGDSFGVAVALSAAGETAVIGAPNDDAAGESSGSVFVFEPTDGEWSQRAKLVGDEGSASESFGTSVAVSDPGDRVVAGDPSANGVRGNAGAAYVYRKPRE